MRGMVAGGGKAPQRIRGDLPLAPFKVLEHDAKGLAAGRREDVNEAAADGDLTALLDALDTLVARPNQVLGELLDPRRVAARDGDQGRPRLLGRHELGNGERGGAHEPAAREGVERTGPFADKVRGRLETGGDAHAAGRQERDAVLADEPADGLRDVAGIGVLGKEDAKASSELLMERGEQERERRLRDAGAGRQRLGEGGQALVGAKTLDE